MQCKMSRANSIYSPNHTPRPAPENCTPSPMSLSQPLPIVADTPASDADVDVDVDVDADANAEQAPDHRDQLPGANNTIEGKPQVRLVLDPLDQTQSQKELSDSSRSRSLSPLRHSSEKPQTKEVSENPAPSGSQPHSEEIPSVSLRQIRISPLSESICSTGENLSPVSHSENTIPNWDAAALRIITFLSSRINPNVARTKISEL